MFDSADQRDIADSLGHHACNCNCHRKGKIPEKWAVRLLEILPWQFYRLNSTKEMRRSSGKIRTTVSLHAELMYSNIYAHALN